MRKQLSWRLPRVLSTPTIPELDASCRVPVPLAVLRAIQASEATVIDNTWLREGEFLVDKENAR